MKFFRLGERTINVDHVVCVEADPNYSDGSDPGRHGRLRMTDPNINDGGTTGCIQLSRAEYEALRHYLDVFPQETDVMAWYARLVGPPKGPTP